MYHMTHQECDQSILLVYKTVRVQISRFHTRFTSLLHRFLGYPSILQREYMNDDVCNEYKILLGKYNRYCNGQKFNKQIERFRRIDMNTKFL